MLNISTFTSSNKMETESLKIIFLTKLTFLKTSTNLSKKKMKNCLRQLKEN